MANLETSMSMIMSDIAIGYIMTMVYPKACEDKDKNKVHNFVFQICRKATRVVMGASIVFIMLMVPSVLSMILMDLAGAKNHMTESQATADFIIPIIDDVFLWMRYINHSINLFVYVLAGLKLSCKCNAVNI